MGGDSVGWWRFLMVGMVIGIASGNAVVWAQTAPPANVQTLLQQAQAAKTAKQYDRAAELLQQAI